MRVRHERKCVQQTHKWQHFLISCMQARPSKIKKKWPSSGASEAIELLTDIYLIVYIHVVRCMSRDSFMCVPWLIHVCAMTHSCVWHDSLACMIGHIQMRDMNYLYTRHIMHVPWLIHACAMTHSCVWHDSFICMIGHIQMRDMTCLYKWHNMHFARRACVYSPYTSSPRGETYKKKGDRAVWVCGCWCSS